MKDDALMNAYALTGLNEASLAESHRKVREWDNREHRESMLNALTLLSVALRKIEALEAQIEQVRAIEHRWRYSDDLDNAHAMVAIAELLQAMEEQ
jgi:hypothetical protein